MLPPALTEEPDDPPFGDGARVVPPVAVAVAVERPPVVEVSSTVGVAELDPPQAAAMSAAESA